MGSHVAEYLRARRALLTPQDVGIPEGVTRRRVAGLRREELAELAGLSADYYVRLEQGRGIQPSYQVLRSLAAAFQLDEDATQHLYRLARLDAGEERPIPQRTRSDVPVTVTALLRELVDTPALVVDGNQDVVLANAAAELASAGLLTDGANFADVVFRPSYREQAGASWAAVAGWSIAALRYYSVPGDRRLEQVLAQLAAHDRLTFADQWGSHDARPFNSVRVPHWVRGLGPVEVDLQGLEIHGCVGLYLVLARGVPRALCRRGWPGTGEASETTSVAVGS